METAGRAAESMASRGRAIDPFLDLRGLVGLQPIEQVRYPEPDENLTPGMVLVIAVFCLAVIGIFHLVQTALVTKAPALPMQTLQDARVEGIRAGMATATENGCSALPHLSQPLQPK